MTVASTKRRDNQMSGIPGEFRMTAQATQLSSMGIASTFQMTFDLNGSDVWPVLAGESFYAELVILGVSNDQDPTEGYMELWKGGVFFSRSTLDNLTNLVPTGDTLTKVSSSRGVLATPTVTDDGSGNMQITMTVTAARNATWKALLGDGLYIAGDRIGSS